MPYDFSKLDKIMPHPVYGWMSWICVINPSSSTYEKLEPLIDEGYQLALKKYKKKFK
jgi:predicted DNA-binding protein (MmcQ/YjbR family)